MTDTGIYYANFGFDESIADDDQIYFNIIGVYNDYGFYESQLTLKGNSEPGLFGEVYKNPSKNEILLVIYDLEIMETALAK